MLEPSGLYRWETDVDVSSIRARTLLVAFEGYIDAGGAQRLLVDHLLSAAEYRVVATFDMDQLFDYRGRRPLMSFDRNRFTAYADPTLLLYLLADRHGTPFLVLGGREPDYQWERVVAAIQQIMWRCGVTQVVTAYGVPMPVPHTRPLWVSAHGTDDDTLDAYPSVFGQMQVIAGLQNLLELRVGESGGDFTGFAIHVPQYLAEGDFPAGALAALENIGTVAGLDLPDEALREAATESQRAITAEVESSTDAAPLISNLESQYDQFVEARRQQALLMGEAGRLPSGEELAEEFEEFLREQDIAGDSDPTPPAES